MGGSLVDAQSTPTYYRCQGARAQPSDDEDEDHQLNMDRGNRGNGGKYGGWEMVGNGSLPEVA